MKTYTVEQKKQYFMEQVERAWAAGQKAALGDNEEQTRPIDLVIYGVKYIVNDVLRISATVHETKINWWETIKRLPSNACPLTVLSDLRWRYPLDFKKESRDLYEED